MKTSTLVWILVVVIVVLGGGWYWYSSMQSMPTPTTSDTSTTTPSGAAGLNGSPNQGNLGQPDTGTPQTPSGDGTSVNQNLILGVQPDATLGNHLSAYNGMTLYTFANDSKGVSNCSGTCATTWPPYTVTSASDINVPANITSSKVGTITRADGTFQVTYNGMPLYYYIKDAKPGDATGQGVGGVWFVVKQ